MLKLKKYCSYKNNTKNKALKKVKSIENSISPVGPCTKIVGVQDCVLDADIKQNKLPGLNLALILNYIA